MAHLAVILLGFLSAVYANLVANYPVNSQLPPVARVSQPFSFVFSQGTFGGSDSKTTYSLSNAPSWLTVDSKTRRMSGTPHDKDVGNPTFDLIAADQSGSARMEVTLVVTADDGPKPGKSLVPQLQKMGATSAPASIIVHSGDSFAFRFDPETFTNTRPSTVYYGTSYPDNAPLPSWIGFDQSCLRFYGSTPNIGPQTFSFNLVASDVVGFSAATMSFNITVSPHILSFERSVETLFVAAGKEFASPKFINSLTLDGRKPTSDDLSDIEVDSPDWLKVDKQYLTFTGTPPKDGTIENVTISVKDIYQNVATLVVTIQYSQFFHDGVDECDAVIGRYFTFEFNSSVLTDESADLDVDLGQQLPWLQYNRDNKTLYGQVPSDLHPDNFTIQLTARDGTAEDSRLFTIKTVTKDDLQDQGMASADSDGGGSSGNTAGIIAMSIFIPLGCVGIVLLLLYCRRRGKRWTKDEDGEESAEKAMSPTPPGPGLSHCQPFEATTQGDPPTMDRAPSPTSKPPKLELEPWWNVSNGDRIENTQGSMSKDNTLSSSTIEWDFAPLQSPEQDENKPPVEPIVKPNRLSFPSSPPVRRRSSERREPLKPIQPRRSLKRNSALSSRSKRYSKRSSGISSISSGLPVRLSGAGHGAGGVGPPGHGVVKVSWQNTQTSFPSDESSVGNLAPLFPRPPARRRDSQEYSKRVSLRAVDRDSWTISEADSLEAFVQGRAKSRNSSNPLFAGPIARQMSSSLRALERARSTASRADTIDTSSSYDDRRQRSVVERPWSLAMSGSVYMDDNRLSTYLHSFPEESPNVQPQFALGNGPSQSSLAQKYSEIIAPLPRFISELSFGQTRGDEASDTYGGPGDTRRWSRSTPALQRDTDQAAPRPLRKSPSMSSTMYDAKARRVSLMRMDEQDPRGLQRDLTGSVTSDIAFV